MQAVIRTGGKQYYVTPGDILEVEKLIGDVGDSITLDDVLMVTGDEDVAIGQPTVSDAAVTAKITGQYRGKKIRVFRYRPKKRIRVRRGHRQYLTRLEIQSITWGDQEFTAPIPEPEPEIEEAVLDEPVLDESTVDETVADEAVEADASENGDSGDAAADDVASADTADGEAIVAEATEDSEIEAQNDAVSAEESAEEAADDADESADEGDDTEETDADENVADEKKE